MDMDSYMHGWRITRVEPSDLFSTVELGIVPLLKSMDKKVGALTNFMGEPTDIFRRWLSGIRARASVAIFQCSEMIHETAFPLRAILVTQDMTDAHELAISLEKVDIPIIQSDVCSIEQMELLAYKPYQRDKGREMRSLLSGELLVLWGGDCKHFEGAVAGARAIFEKKPAADLAQLIANDVRSIALNGPEVREAEIPGGKRRLAKDISNKEFENIAKRAMEMRRIKEPLRVNLIREIRKAVAQ